MIFIPHSCRSTPVNSWMFRHQVESGATTTTTIPWDKTLACWYFHVSSLIVGFSIIVHWNFIGCSHAIGSNTRITPGTDCITAPGATAMTVKRRRSPMRIHCWTKTANRGLYDASELIEIIFQLKIVIIMFASYL